MKESGTQGWESFGLGEREIQTDGERNRPTQESSTWFTAGFVGDPLRCWEIRRPAWKQER